MSVGPIYALIFNNTVKLNSLLKFVAVVIRIRLAGANLITLNDATSALRGQVNNRTL